MFREFPNNKFSLKHLASASGGATKEGRRETLEILGRLFEEGVVEECAREKYRLMQTHLPHYEGVADMAPSGSVYVKVEGQENDIFVNQRNAANALNGGGEQGEAAQISIEPDVIVVGAGLAGTANAVDAAGAASDTTGAVATTADDTGGRTVLDCRQSGEGFYNGICHTYNGKIVPRF